MAPMNSKDALYFIDRPIGIDLGTTNCGVALLDPSEKDLVVYADQFSKETVPSAIAWDASSETFLIGRKARQRRGSEHEPVESFKRSMGQITTLQVGPHALTPEALSTTILSFLHAEMSTFMNARVESDVDVRVQRAVITVPAYFDAPQVEATRRAGEEAGLHVLAVLQEPTAAAIYHTFRRKLKDGTFLVYDLGGGTFDVSIIRCLAGEYQVLAIDGDNYLGGDDFDRRFAEHLRETLVTKGYKLQLNIENDPQDAQRFQRLVQLAQGIKEALSQREIVHVHENGIFEDQAGESVDIDEEIHRTVWEDIVAPLIETSLTCCRRALAQSEANGDVTLADIDHVILVGGSTRTPLVVRRVTEALCAPSRCATPLQEKVDTCVALGAAVHAAQIGGLKIGNPKTELWFTTPLITKSDKLRIYVDLEKAPPDTRQLALLRNGEELARTAIDAVPATGIRWKAKLGKQETQLHTLELRDEDGINILELPITLYRGDVKPRASELSQPAVIAKNISIEVMRNGKRARKVLLARGTGLPAETAHTFATGDRSGAVVLRILQDRLPIKTLMLEIDANIAIGTPVNVTLRCDTAMRLEANAEVGGQALWVQLESPPQSKVTAEQVEDLLARAEIAANELWGHEAKIFEYHIEPLVIGIRETLGIDPAKRTALCARLENLLDEYHSGESTGMNPPRTRFDKIMQRLRRIVYASGGGLMGMSIEAWETRINTLESRADEAWQANDATLWRRVCNEAQALRETANEEQHTRIDPEDPNHLAGVVRNAENYGRRIRERLIDFIPSASDEVRTKQLAERDRLLTALQAHSVDPLKLMSECENTHQLRKRINGILAEIQRIEIGLERLSSLGVVVDRNPTE